MVRSKVAIEKYINLIGVAYTAVNLTYLVYLRPFKYLGDLAS